MPSFFFMRAMTFDFFFFGHSNYCGLHLLFVYYTCSNVTYRIRNPIHDTYSDLTTLFKLNMLSSLWMRKLFGEFIVLVENLRLHLDEWI